MRNRKRTSIARLLGILVLAFCSQPTSLAAQAVGQPIRTSLTAPQMERIWAVHSPYKMRTDIRKPVYQDNSMIVWLLKSFASKDNINIYKGRQLYHVQLATVLLQQDLKSKLSENKLLREISDPLANSIARELGINRNQIGNVSNTYQYLGHYFASDCDFNDPEVRYGCYRYVYVPVPYNLYFDERIVCGFMCKQTPLEPSTTTFYFPREPGPEREWRLKLDDFRVPEVSLLDLMKRKTWLGVTPGQDVHERSRKKDGWDTVIVLGTLLAVVGNYSRYPHADRCTEKSKMVWGIISRFHDEPGGGGERCRFHRGATWEPSLIGDGTCTYYGWVCKN
jgi:hypothetical protein